MVYLILINIIVMIQRIIEVFWLMILMVMELLAVIIEAAFRTWTTFSTVLSVIASTVLTVVSATVASVTTVITTTGTTVVETAVASVTTVAAITTLRTRTALRTFTLYVTFRFWHQHLVRQFIFTRLRINLKQLNLNLIAFLDTCLFNSLQTFPVDF